MKYKFVRKGEYPSSEDIKNTMDFDKVEARSGVLVGAKITSSVLKGFSWVKTTLISLAIVAFIASATYVAYPEYTEAQFAQFNHMILDQFSPRESNELETYTENDEPELKPFTQDSLITDGFIEEEEPDSSEMTEEETEEKRANSLLLYEDLLVRAKPLPTTKIFLQYIDKELEYPVEAIKDSIEGYVEVYFKVNKMGQTEDFKISKSLGESFDNEAIRVIKNYRNWKPAVYLGEAQEDFLKLKVTFTLQHSGSETQR